MDFAHALATHFAKSTLQFVKYVVFVMLCSFKKETKKQKMSIHGIHYLNLYMNPALTCF